jgi:hypothetical protein
VHGLLDVAGERVANVLLAERTPLGCATAGDSQ